MSTRRGGEGSRVSTEGVVFTAVLLCISLVFLLATIDLRPSSALVPRAVGVPLVVLLLYRLIRDMRARRRGPEPEPERKGEERPAEAKPRAGQVREARRSEEFGAVFWLLGLAAAATILGFVAGPALHVFAWARFRARERTAVALAAAAATALAIPILFGALLGARLPQGVLGRLL